VDRRLFLSSGRVGELAAFDEAAAGEADEGGREVGDHCRQVHPQAVVFPGVAREQAHHVEPQRARAGEHELKPAGDIFVGCGQFDL